MRGKTSLLRGWLSGAVYIKRKRSERSLPQPTQAQRGGPCPNDLVSLDSKSGQLNPSPTAQRSRPPCACHMGEESFPRPRDVRNFSNPRHKAREGAQTRLAAIDC